MSIAYNASPWINDNPDQQSQKRIPTMRKSIKKATTIPKPEFMPPPNPDAIAGPGSFEPNANIPSTSSSYVSNNVEPALAYAPTPLVMQTMNDQEKRQDRVNEILQKMNMDSVHIENDGGYLGNFKVPDRPMNQPRNDNMDHIPADEPVQILPPMFQPPLANQRQSYTANLGENVQKIAPYHQAYEMPPTVASWARKEGGYSGNGGQSGGNVGASGASMDRLLDKINYMIHLLEQQQNEKTNNSLEEFVMFSMVGVFIIYVLDSFTRSAKYTR